MEFNKGGALTVGQLKEALANVPDNFEIGSSILDATGYISKVAKILLHRGGEILIMDVSSRSGSFSDEEAENSELETVLSLFKK